MLKYEAKKGEIFMKEHNFEQIIIDLPTKKVNGQSFIDTDFILYLIDFIKELDGKPKHKKIVEETTAVAFGKKVRSIWSDCIAHGPKPWENDANIIGEALMVDYTFDPEKLMEHADEISKLIAMVHKATTYEGMKYLDTGEKWSELRQPVSFLMALGNALKLVDFKNDRRTWSEEESKNPEVTFTLK